MENYDRNEKHEDKGLEAQRAQRNNLGLKIAVAMMSLVIIGLVVGLIIVGGNYQKNSGERMTDASYNKAYFDLVAETNDIQVRLDKIAASNSAAQQEQMLYEVWKNAELAEMSLASLNAKDSNVNHLKKFMNQLGDYCHYLALSAENKPLTTEQEKTLKSMSDILRDVNLSLGEVQTNLEGGNLTFNDGALNNAMNGIFEKFNDSSVEYPQMIYDGPFSDSLTDREVKGLSGNMIDEAAGRDIVSKIMKDEILQNIIFDGECNGDIDSLYFTAVLQNGEKVDLELAKKGGSLLLLSRNKEFTSPQISVDKCVEAAEKFAADNGFKNMASVWISNIDGAFIVNLAPVQDNAILYPDLVKVKVSSDDGKIIGFDSQNHAMNHIARNLKTPSLTLSQAKSKIKSSLSSNEGRLALIPYRSTQELLTYEFACESNDGLYFVYIDAMTGEEANILIVIDSENGTLLM